MAVQNIVQYYMLNIRWQYWVDVVKRTLTHRLLKKMCHCTVSLFNIVFALYTLPFLALSAKYAFKSLMDH